VKKWECDKLLQNLHLVTRVFLIFIGPCIVIYSYTRSTTNKMHMSSQIIYSCKTLYMFRTVFPSIIRSSKLHIQQRYMSNSCCYLLLSGMRWNAVPSQPKCSETSVYKNSDAGELLRRKYTTRTNKMHNFYIRVSD
jgi:hypothetical protein